MGTDRHTHSQPSLYPIHHPSPQTNMKTLLLAVIPMVIFALVDAQYGRGGCDWRECRNNRYLAQRCCDSSGTCCDFANGGGNYGGGYNNNNKPGNCPPYNGRKKRSPRGRFPGNNGYNNGGQGYNPGYNNGYNNGGYNPGYGSGNGYNPGYGNGNGYNPGYNNNNRGSCIRDSDCSADLKCCYIRSGYQCTRPNYYG